MSPRRLDIAREPARRGVAHGRLARARCRAGRLPAAGTRRRASPPAARARAGGTVSLRPEERLDDDGGRDLVRAAKLGQRTARATATAARTAATARSILRPSRPPRRELSRMTTDAALLAALAASLSRCSPRLPARAGAPGLRGRSAVAEAAAESLAARLGHRRRRGRAGSHLGRASRLRLDDRAHRDRRGDESEDGGRVLRAGAAGARVRRGGQPRGHWGGPGDKYDWPVSPGGIAVDAQATSGSPRPGRLRSRAPAQRERRRGRGGAAPTAPPPQPQDAHVLKFSRDGRVPASDRQGRRSRRQRQHDGAQPARGVAIDAAANEVYVADGFVNQPRRRLRRRRPARTSGTGAVGRSRRRDRLHETRPRSCVRVAKDGTVYVCDRGNNRVQAFDKNGKFLKQGIVAKDTRGTGSVWDVAFSSDPQQRYLFVADGHDQKVVHPAPRHARDRRQFRRRRPLSRAPSTASAASRSIRSGNVYTGENARRQARAEVRAEGRPPVKRHVLDRGSSFAAALACSRRSSSARWRARPRAQAKTAVMAPRFEVDPLWPKRLPNHWVLGQAIGVPSMRRITSGSCIGDNLLGANEAAAEPESADRVVLRQGAAGPRVRSRRQRRRPLGRPRGRATTGRRRITASRSITRATSGSARNDGNRRARPEVHEGRQVPDAVRQAGPEQGQQRSRELRPAGEDLRGREGQRGVHRRRLRQQARRRHRRRHRQVQALLGRLRQQAGRHQPRALRPEGAARASSSARRCTAPTCRTTASSTSAIGRTIASRSSRRTARS